MKKSQKERVSINDVRGLPYLLTVRQLAQLLQMAPATVHRYVREGAIPAVRIGNRVRVPRDRILRMLEAAGAAGDGAVRSLEAEAETQGRGF